MLLAVSDPRMTGRLECNNCVSGKGRSGKTITKERIVGKAVEDRTSGFSHDVTLESR